MHVATTQLAEAPIETPVLVLSGEIDHGNAPVLSAAVDGALEENTPIILFDMTDVVYIDSGGVSVLLSTVRRLRDRGWLGIVNPNANVRRLMEIVGLSLDESFRMFTDNAEALAKIKEFAGE
jgi:anti-sigma B factor antagonist